MKLKSTYNAQLREPRPSMPCCSRGFKVVSLPSNLFSKDYISAAKKRTWQKCIQRTLLRKGVYTSLKGAINLIAKSCCKRVKTWLASDFFFLYNSKARKYFSVDLSPWGLCVSLQAGQCFSCCWSGWAEAGSRGWAQGVALGAVPRALLRSQWQLPGSRIWPCTAAHATDPSQNGICPCLWH